MPRAPKLCVHCTTKATSGSYCETHQPVPFQGARERWRHAQPASWPTLRQKALKRDDHCCVICGRPGDIVDHRVPVAEGGDWSLDNLQTICPEDHQAKIQEEAARGRARAQKLRRYRR